jgi:hypothetical protein
MVVSAMVISSRAYRSLAISTGQTKRTSSSQEDLWELVFQIAHRLNIQVFATTHSWDCIEGFQKAAQVEENEEALLIRLEYKKDDIVATIFDKRKLAIATRESIEVR